MKLSGLRTGASPDSRKLATSGSARTFENYSRSHPQKWTATRLATKAIKILLQGEVVSVDSSGGNYFVGLVVKQQGSLRVHNRIYKLIFDNRWIELHGNHDTNSIGTTRVWPTRWRSIKLLTNLNHPGSGIALGFGALKRQYSKKCKKNLAQQLGVLSQHPRLIKCLPTCWSHRPALLLKTLPETHCIKPEQSISCLRQVRRSRLTPQTADFNCIPDCLCHILRLLHHRSI